MPRPGWISAVLGPALASLAVLLLLQVLLPSLAASPWSAIALALIAGLAAAPAIRRLHAVRQEAFRPYADAARAMAAGDLHLRAPVSFRDDSDGLGIALNDLAAGLESTLQAVTAERNRLAGVLASMVEAVLVTDDVGRIALTNPAFREIFGTAADLAGRSVKDATGSAEIQSAVEAVLVGAPPTPRTLGVGGRTLEARFSILRGNVGTFSAVDIAGVVVVFHDTTELRRLETVRKELVANASHELRTPVSAILGAAETLENGALKDPEAAVTFVSSIARQATRLSALVQDLLDLSRLESRAAAEPSAEIPPGAALERAAKAFADAATRKKITVEVVQTPSLPAVRADPALLDRALGNLVQNAIRYTREGGRVVLRAAEDRASHPPAVRFEVEDDGIGIPVSALPRIFERFYRVDPARSRELGGTGLGLAIVKHAIETMGGNVSVKSVEGKGSTFSFTLPSA